jgi:hypothetical protein
LLEAGISADSSSPLILSFSPFWLIASRWLPRATSETSAPARFSADIAADRAGAVDADFHAVLWSLLLSALAQILDDAGKIRTFNPGGTILLV